MAAKIIITMEHEKHRQLLGDCLENVGHDVTKVETFHDAMEFLRSADFDVIVSDVHLQNGGTVFDFLRWVKGDPHIRSIPFVCFSAEPSEIGKYLADGVRTAARALGAARYITMENFDTRLFQQEIEWLIPQERAGSYYLVNRGDGEDGHVLKTPGNGRDKLKD